MSDTEDEKKEEKKPTTYEPMDFPEERKSEVKKTFEETSTDGKLEPREVRPYICVLFLFVEETVVLRPTHLHPDTVENFCKSLAYPVIHPPSFYRSMGCCSHKRSATSMASTHLRR